MKNLIVITIFLFISAHAEDNPVQEYQLLIEQEKYGEALTLLNRVQREKDIPDSLRLEILKMLAVFYDKMVGDTRKVTQYCEEIIRFPASVNQPVRSFAEREIARLRAMEVKYRKENNFLKEARMISMSGIQKDKIISSNNEIHDFVRKNPDYYRIAEMYYYLGRNYLNLKKYGKAYRYFIKAVKLKPGINSYLPVTSQAKGAYIERNRSLIHKWSWTIIPLIIIITVIVFYSSRPWQWFNVKHLFLFIGIIFLWWLVFTISTHYFGAVFDVPSNVIDEIRAERPSFIQAEPGSPGSEVLKYLFRYGIIGVVGTFVFVLGMSSLRNRKLAGILSTLYGLLLFSVLTGIFYLRYCDEKSNFYSEKQGLFRYLKGNYYFNLKDHSVYVLADPNSYSNLNLKFIDETEFVGWIVKHCRFDSLTSEDLIFQED